MPKKCYSNFWAPCRKAIGGFELDSYEIYKENASFCKEKKNLETKAKKKALFTDADQQQQ